MVAHYNSEQNINGIVCDICGQTFIDKFEYYSSKFDYIQIDKAMGVKGIRDLDRRYLDLDFCKQCFEKLKTKVVAQIEKRKAEQSTWTASAKIIHKQNMKPGG